MLLKVLTTRDVRLGGAKHALHAEPADASDRLLTPLSPEGCAAVRDALARYLYGRLFDWVVRAINERLGGGNGGKGGDAKAPLIHLVDLFGFEMLRVNSFEQLCINYADERLHQLFVEQILVAEEIAHLDEGVAWPRLMLPDNQPCIDLLSNRGHGLPDGLLQLLDNTTRLPNATEASFFTQVHEVKPLAAPSGRKPTPGPPPPLPRRHPPIARCCGC
jgi:myosin heavy subunit